MQRRQLLRLGAGLGTTALAGCSGLTGEEASAEAPRARLELLALSAQETVQRLHQSVGTDEALFEEMLANGSATVETRRPVFQDGNQVVHGGTLYEITARVTDQRPATVYPIVLESLANEYVTPAPDAARVEFSALPAIDRQLFRERGLAEGDLLGIGTALVYPDGRIDESALVPVDGYTIIEWASGARGQFSSRHEAHPAQLKTYRYTATPTAESLPAYVQRLREAHAVDLTGLPEAQATLLETAAEEGYRVPPGGTPSQAFEALADRFRGQPDIHSVIDSGREPSTERAAGSYLVRFDGEPYWLQLWVRQAA